MKFQELYRKNVSITTNDGQILKGIVVDYTSALDNESDSASITIRIGEALIEVFENEIETIKELPS